MADAINVTPELLDALRAFRDSRGEPDATTHLLELVDGAGLGDDPTSLIGATCQHDMEERGPCGGQLQVTVKTYLSVDEGVLSEIRGGPDLVFGCEFDHEDGSGWRPEWRAEVERRYLSGEVED